VLKENGVMDTNCKDCTATQKWEMRNGVFRTWFEDKDNGK